MTFQDPCFGKSTMYARIDSPPVNADIRKEIKEQISNYLNI
jgi:hypothetical protein